MKSSSLLAILTFVLASAAQAGPGVPNPVSEPGSVELLAIGGVVAAIVAIRKRRK